MTALPTIVYKSPGPHAGEHGRTYESKGVKTKAELDEAHAAGWFDSVHEACATAAGLLPLKPKTAAPAPAPAPKAKP